jgi:hypothetical protein
MTQKHVVTVGLALAVLAGAIGTYSLAQSDKDSGTSARSAPKHPRHPARPVPGSGFRRPARPGMHSGSSDDPRRDFRTDRAARFQKMVQLLARMRGATFNPGEAGLIAIGGLKDDVRRKPEEVIADLESQLGKTKSLGLRNAIRLQLRDIYKARGDNAKLLELLKAMVSENDAALAEREAAKGRMPGPE